MSTRDKDPECRGVLLQETPNVIQVCTISAPISGESWWLPRSQIGYMRKDRVEGASGPGLTHVVFTLPEWLIEKKQCWDLVP